MTERRTDDGALLAELAVLATHLDPVPPEVVTSAKASFARGAAWDVALAQLAYDSTTDESDSRALVRGGPGPRDLTFEGPALTVEIVIESAESLHGDRYRILGQLVPGQPAQIEIRRPDNSSTISADHLGRFAVEDAGRGPLSLRCTPAGAGPTETEWILI
jgi:hypothetical protein